MSDPIQYNDVKALERAVLPIVFEIRPAAPFDTHVGIIASVPHDGSVHVGPLAVVGRFHQFTSMVNAALAIAGSVGMDLVLEIENDPADAVVEAAVEPIAPVAPVLPPVAPVVAPVVEPVVESTPAPVLEAVTAMEEPVVVTEEHAETETK